MALADAGRHGQYFGEDLKLKPGEDLSRRAQAAVTLAAWEYTHHTEELIHDQ